MNTYPKIYNLGHAAIKDIYLDNVVIEEKIDGSQFSFGIYDGVIKCRSKNKEIDINNPEKMFGKAVKVVKLKRRLLHPGWTYRAEYLRSPKHNTIKYDRVPRDNLIIFDVNDGEESYLDRTCKELESERIGLQCVPMIYNLTLPPSINNIESVLNIESYLGGSKIEGIVIKNYHRFGVDGKALMGKYVSEKFKEQNHVNWKREKKPIIEAIIGQYLSEARWRKGIQCLRDNGELTHTPKDIGKIIFEIQKDIEEECGNEIKELLYKKNIKKILKGCVSGFPEFYKKFLLENS